jgi:hypothetical protein
MEKNGIKKTNVDLFVTWRLMKRWHNYVLIGLFFGIFDWFYLDWLSRGLGPNLGENPLIVIPIMIGLNYGIWLVPVIPVVIYETKQADSIKGPILAAILTWCCALFSYYIYYAILLSLGKLPNLTHLNLFSERYVGFWGDYWRMFRWIILSQFLEWIPIAIVGGGIIAAFFWWIIRMRKINGELQQPLTE